MNPTRFLNGWRAAALLVIALAIPLWHIHIINRQMPSSHSDLVDDWIGVRDALEGKNPYSAEVTRDIQMVYYGRPVTPADNVPDQAFPYPAFLVIPFAPLAPLSWPSVRLVYLLIMVPALLLSLWLCARLVQPDLRGTRLTFTVLLAFCSWPVMWALRLQQPTLFVAAVVFSGCLLLSREHGGAGGILLAFATVKPQLVFPLLLWLCVWACARRMWSFIGSFALTMAGLLLWTERLVPGWFPTWLAALHRYGQSHGVLPLENLFGHWIGLASTALLVAYSSFLLWRLRFSPARSPEFAMAVSIALAISLCATPTILPVIYNQILLIPACLLLFQARPAGTSAVLVRRIALAMVCWGYAAVYIAAVIETAFGSRPVSDLLPFQNLLLPVMVLLALSLCASPVPVSMPEREGQAFV